METHIQRHEPLYLKHRPQALAELVGQTAVSQTLSNAINFERLSHAYLFTGPRGTGKTSSARILAKSLNCKASDKATVAPCQECVSCVEIKQGNSPAVFEIDAASNNSVDDARILIERAPLVAPGGRYKIYIIDECHMLTKEAFNALLKTIEQPPPNVVFILATTEEHKVLPTIVSRCQRLMFRLVTQEDLLIHLRNIATKENIQITDQALDFVARRSGGGLRDALSLLDQASLLAAPGSPVDVNDLLALLGALHEDVLLGISKNVLHRQGHDVLAAATSLLHEGREPSIIVQELARHFLNLSKASYLAELSRAQDATSKLIVGSPNYISALCELAPLFERSELSQIVEILDRLEQTCRRSTQPAMHLEVGLLALCHRQDMVLARELAERVSKLENALSGGAQFAPQSARPAMPARPIPAVAQAPAPQPTARPAPAPIATAPAHVEQRPAQPYAPPVAVQEAPVPAQMAVAASAPTVQSMTLATTEGPEVENIAAPPAVTTDALPDVTGSNANDAASDDDEDEEGGSSFTFDDVDDDDEAAPPAPAPTAPAPPSQQLPITPAPVQETAAAPAPAASDSKPPEEIDYVWSQVLEELQRKHLPTFSLAGEHAIPISLTDKELTLGCKEAFMKTIENKVDKIKAACAIVLGAPIHVRVKPVSMELPSAKSANKPRERAATAAPARTPSPGPDADEESEPAPHQYTQQPTSDASASDAARILLETSPTVSRPSAVARVRSSDSTIIKEAYKLFEGPGSRQIG